MARTRTLAQLRAEVRDRADIENSLHITDAQIDRYINQSGAALHAQMVDACEDWFVTQEGTNAPAPSTGVGASATEVSLNAAFYKLLALEIELNGRKYRLPRWTWAEHAARTSAPDGSGASCGYTYRISGALYIITPALPINTPIRVYFVPAYVDLVVDADAYDGRDGWEEWVVCDSAIKCMIKEETDPGQVRVERDALFARLMSQVRRRDLAAPHRVQDTSGRLDEYYPRRLA